MRIFPEKVAHVSESGVRKDTLLATAGRLFVMRAVANRRMCAADSRPRTFELRRIRTRSTGVLLEQRGQRNDAAL